MPEYIEREALIAFLEDNHDDKDWLVNQYNADWICSWIESQPAADVVAVVRCKDCKHWKKQDFMAGNDRYHLEYGGFCPNGRFARYENDFCSYGERRSDNAQTVV